MTFFISKNLYTIKNIKKIIYGYKYSTFKQEDNFLAG